MSKPKATKARRAAPVLKNNEGRQSAKSKAAQTAFHAAECVRRARIIEGIIATGLLPTDRRGGGGTGFYAEAARQIGCNVGTIKRQLDRGTVVPNWKKYKPAPAVPPVPAPSPPRDLQAEVVRSLRKTPGTIEQLASRLGAEKAQVQDALDASLKAGISLHLNAGLWFFDAPQIGIVGGPSFELVSRPDNTFCFGATGDNHLGNKQSRLDVLNDLYDRFKAADAQAVFNTGNWIDGEARFNKNELHIHGMDNQLQYLAENYPRRDGLTTYAVSGDDHEGWYAQREGVNIGRYAEMKMRDLSRTDWVDLGYMEAHIRLVNYNTGAVAILAVVHPGGGSAYATSYSIQKIIEALEAGEKPDVGLYGHYHKLWAGNIRGVWCIQTGTTEDQTTFMRKNKLEAQVGGVLARLEQDPETGRIIACTPQMVRHFVKGYQQGRWNLAGDVRHVRRGV